MKKILITILLILLCACNSSNKTPKYTYEIQSDPVDMSSYEGVISTKHNFRSIVVSEFYNCIDNESSGIFYLGRSNCGCCQTVTKYLSEVASELGVTIYYLDAYNQKEPLTEEKNYMKLMEYMKSILKEEDGEKVLLTPHLFTVINGKYVGSQVCYDNLDFDGQNPKEQQIESLKEVYRMILQPFVKG